MTKGYTVHFQGADGHAVCGREPRGSFMGFSPLTINPRRVTCPTCDRIIRRANEGHATPRDLAHLDPDPRD